MTSSTVSASRPWQPLVADPATVRRVAREMAIEPLLATILVHRGLHDGQTAREWLSPSVDQLHDPMGLIDMERASERLAGAIAGGEPILIYGDADMDGLSGTALMVEVLTALGARPLVHVPNRAYEGYSINEQGVAHVLRTGAKLVVSVDNGTSACEPVAALQRAGVDVIITDHHLPGPQLPPAFAVVNPRRADCTYPFGGLSGTGVAFKLVCATASRMQGRGRAPAALGQVLGEALAWVAMGTVADVMPLVDENRVLVARGLSALPRSRSPGLRALCGVAGLGPGAVATAEDIAFRLGPRINAAARMGRSDVAMELVTCTDGNRADVLAAQLDEFNRERQAAERQLVAELQDQIAATPDGEPFICFADHWNTGLLGLVAGRIARQRRLPAVLASWANGEPGKGSSRSVGGFDLHGALARCSQHLTEHGGHANAAGFSMERKNSEAFRQAFLDAWNSRGADDSNNDPLRIEGELPLVSLGLRFVQWIDQLEPFGEGNRRPVLASSGVELLLARRMGGDGTHLELQIGQGPVRMRAVAFGRGDLADQLQPGTLIDLVYHPKLNRWRGREQVELELLDVRSAVRRQPLDLSAGN